MSYYITKYRCGTCTKPHDTHGEARRCCEPPEPDEAIFCARCNTEYMELKYAERCFKRHIAEDELKEFRARCLSCGNAITEDAARDWPIVGSVPHCRACLNRLGLAA